MLALSLFLKIMLVIQINASNHDSHNCCVYASVSGLELEELQKCDLFLSLIIDPGWQTGAKLKKICVCRGHGLSRLGRHAVSNRIGGSVLLSDGCIRSLKSMQIYIHIHIWADFPKRYRQL